MLKDLRLVLIGRLAPSPRNEIAKIGLEIINRGATLFDLVIAQTRLEGTQNVERPLPQWAALIARYAEQVTDQIDRQRRRQIGNQVDLAAFLRIIEQTLDQRLDTRHQLAQRGLP